MGKINTHNYQTFDYGNEESYQKLHKKKTDDKPQKDFKRRKKNNGSRKG